MIAQDLRHAFRALRAHRLLTATLILTLGLGIGANAAIFSLLNTVVLRSLPVQQPDRLFQVRAGFPLASGNRFSGPVIERLRASAPPDVTIAAMTRVARVYTRTEGAAETEPAALQLVSSSYFQILGLRPALGQLLPAENGYAPNAAGRGEPSLLAAAFWRTSGRDRSNRSRSMARASRSLASRRKGSAASGWSRRSICGRRSRWIAR